MKRQIITVDDINAAQREKKTALSVPYSSIITPAAQDLAISFGMSLSRETCPGRAPKGRESASAAGVNAKPAPAASVKSAPAEDKIFAEIRAKVLAKLPAELHSSEIVDQLIRKHMPASGCGCDSCRPAATGRSAADVAPKLCADSWRNCAAGAIHINSGKLPWKDFSGAGAAGAVHILDAVTAADGAPFAVGYMEWKDAAFPWRLDYHEVCIVLEGRLRITLGGSCIEGGPGDALYLPKGSEVEFAASGYVKFAYVTWPADWAK